MRKRDGPQREVLPLREGSMKTTSLVGPTFYSLLWVYSVWYKVNKNDFI